MIKKIMRIVSFLTISAIVIPFLVALPVSATGEKYTWNGNTKITALKGGTYTEDRTYDYVPDKSSHLERLYQLNWNDSNGTCVITIHISTSKIPYGKTGTVTFDNDEICNKNFGLMDKNITISGNAGGAPDLPDSKKPVWQGFSKTDHPHHLHIQSFDEEGLGTSGEMMDGKNKELTFFLLNSKQEVIWVVCSTATDAESVKSHWLIPVYGSTPTFIDGEKGPTIQNVRFEPNDRAGCHGAEEANSWNGTDTSKRDGRKRWYDKGLTVGEQYTIVGIGVGGDLSLIPDTNSQYYDLMKFTILDYDGTKFIYEYTGSDKKEDGTKDGKTKYVADVQYTVRYTSLSLDACTGLSSKHPCADFKPTKDETKKTFFTFNVFSTKGGGIFELINGIIKWITGLLVEMIENLSGVLTNIILIPHGYFTASGGMTGVLNAWGVARGLANSIFVLILIVIAIFNILRFNIEKYDIRSTLPRLIVAILLVNFSLFLVGLLVDATNIVTIGIQSAFTAVGSDSVISGVSGLTDNVVNTGGSIIMSLIFVVVYLVVFLWLLILLSFRIAAILAMAALAPVAFMFHALPATSGLLGTWWKNLVRFLVMGPVIAFIILMAKAVLEGIAASPGGGSVILQMFLAIAFVAIAGMIPVMLGGKAFSAAGGLAKKLGKQASSIAQRSKLGGKLANAGQRIGATGQGVTGLKGKLLRGAIKPVTGLAGAGGKKLGIARAGAISERGAKAAKLAALKNTPQLMNDVKSTDAETSFAALATLSEKGLAGKAQYDQFFAKHHKSPYTSQAVGLGLKAAKADPHIADSLNENWKKISGGAPTPSKLLEGSVSLARTLSPRDLAEMPVGNLTYTPDASKPKDIRQNEYRRAFKMDGRTFQQLSSAHQAAILGIQKSDDPEVTLESQLETVFRNVREGRGEGIPEGFATFGTQDTRDAILGSIGGGGSGRTGGDEGGGPTGGGRGGGDDRPEGNAGYL